MPENSVVVEVAERRRRRAFGSALQHVLDELVHRRGLPRAAAPRELRTGGWKRPSSALVAALGVEVVGDHEDLLAAEDELAGQRLAAGRSRPRWPGRSGPGRRSARPCRRRRSTATAVVDVAARAVDEAHPRRVEEEACRMLPPGWPPSSSSTGSISRHCTRGPPAATMAAVSLLSVWSAATVPSSVAPLLSWISSSATMSGDRRLVTTPCGERGELGCGSAGARFSTLYVATASCSRRPARWPRRLQAAARTVPSVGRDERVAAELVVVQRAGVAPRGCRRRSRPGSAAVGISDWISSRPVLGES